LVGLVIGFEDRTIFQPLQRPIDLHPNEGLLDDHGVAADRHLTNDVRQLLRNLDDLLRLGRPIPQVVEQGEGAARGRPTQSLVELFDDLVGVGGRPESAIADMKTARLWIKGRVEHDFPLMAGSASPSIAQAGFRKNQRVPYGGDRACT
jgi:hypothetical protein